MAASEILWVYFYCHPLYVHEYLLWLEILHHFFFSLKRISIQVPLKFFSNVWFLPTHISFHCWLQYLFYFVSCNYRVLIISCVCSPGLQGWRSGFAEPSALFLQMAQVRFPTQQSVTPAPGGLNPLLVSIGSYAHMHILAHRHTFIDILKIR